MPRELLLSCLHTDPTRLAVDALPGADSRIWDELLRLAEWQRVRPLLYHQLKGRGFERHVPPRILESLRMASRHTALRNLALLAEFGQIARALAAEHAPVIALKGAHLIGAVYREVGLREMGDLDVLVRPEHLSRAVDVLRARGYRPTRPFRIDEDLARTHHLAPFVKDGAARIEIHWNITEPLDAHAIDPDELWRRAVPWSSSHVSSLGLCLEDLVLHLCFHASFQHRFGFVGLRPCCDIATILEEGGAGIDWEAFVRTARAWRWTRGVYLSLRLARDLVGAGVPAWALDLLHPAGVEAGVLEAASDHIFAPQWVPESVAHLVGQQPALIKLQQVGARIDVSRSETRVGSSAWRSLHHLWLRLARIGYVLRTHGRSVVRLLFNTDAVLTASAERTNRIREWLDVP